MMSTIYGSNINFFTFGRGRRLGNDVVVQIFFILENNGILLGLDRTYVKELSRFRNLHVRVCLKGYTPEEFSWLTDAKKWF